MAEIMTAESTSDPTADLTVDLTDALTIDPTTTEPPTDPDPVHGLYGYIFSGGRDGRYGFWR